MNFDPVNFMNSADAANIQVMSQVDESKFKDYTDRVLSDLNAHHQQALGSLPNQLNQMNNKMLAKNFSRLQMLSVSASFFLDTNLFSIESSNSWWSPNEVLELGKSAGPGWALQSEPELPQGELQAQPITGCEREPDQATLADGLELPRRS